MDLTVFRKNPWNGVASLFPNEAGAMCPPDLFLKPLQAPGLRLLWSKCFPDETNRNVIFLDFFSDFFRHTAPIHVQWET